MDDTTRAGDNARAGKSQAGFPLVEGGGSLEDVADDTLDGFTEPAFTYDEVRQLVSSLAEVKQDLDLVQRLVIDALAPAHRGHLTQPGRAACSCAISPLA